MFLCLLAEGLAVRGAETQGEPAKRISAIKTLELQVSETIRTNKSENTSTYVIKYKLPDSVRKEMLTPELNKGELYVYSKGKKLTWLPLFKQKKVETIPEGEDKIIDILRYIFRMEKEDAAFRKEYYAGKLKGVKLGEKTTIQFSGYTLCDGYLFPLRFTVLEKTATVGEIKITSVKTDPKFDEKEFSTEE